MRIYVSLYFDLVMHFRVSSIRHHSVSSTAKWSRKLSIWIKISASGAKNIRFFSATAVSANSARGARATTALTACGISIWPTSRNYSSDTKSEQNVLRSKMKLFDTPTDEQRLLVIQPEYKRGRVENPYISAEHKLEEAISLAEAISGWSVHSQRIDAVRQTHNKTFFGKGKIAELKQFAGKLPITGVYLNVPHLTPIQHKVLEGIFGTEVFDRFGIVLRIFKERARTKEAKLQVALAEVPYLRARLLEADGHIQQHRITGGGGEAHHVAAKRNLHQREVTLRKELKSIRDRRHVMSVQRKKHHLPVVAVVGYTNAGKTTLIKALSKDESMSPKDMLFATLDTTVHAGTLPCGQKVLYVDTIGFVSDLPHELVESFSSTLDDVTQADVLVHVRDASHPLSYAQKADVMKVLRQLDLTPGLVESTIEVLNKSDKVGGEVATAGEDCTIPISALHGTGLSDLLQRLERAVIARTKRKFWKIILPLNGPELSWLYHEPEATVCAVGETISTAEMPPTNSTGHSTTNRLSPSDVDMNYISVRTILTEAAFGKFQAKFANTVRMIENVDG